MRFRGKRRWWSSDGPSDGPAGTRISVAHGKGRDKTRPTCNHRAAPQVYSVIASAEMSDCGNGSLFQGRPTGRSCSFDLSTSIFSAKCRTRWVRETPLSLPVPWLPSVHVPAWTGSLTVGDFTPHSHQASTKRISDATRVLVVFPGGGPGVPQLSLVPQGHLTSRKILASALV